MTCIAAGRACRGEAMEVSSDERQLGEHRLWDCVALRNILPPPSKRSYRQQFNCIDSDLISQWLILSFVQTFIIKGKEFCIQEAQLILANLIIRGNLNRQSGCHGNVPVLFMETRSRYRIWEAAHPTAVIFKLCSEEWGSWERLWSWEVGWDSGSHSIIPKAASLWSLSYSYFRIIQLWKFKEEKQSQELS